MEKVVVRKAENRKMLLKTLQTIIVSTALFIGCPGDDIVALAQSILPLPKSASSQTLSAQDILGLMYADKKLRDKFPKLKKPKVEVCDIQKNLLSLWRYFYSRKSIKFRFLIL